MIVRISDSSSSKKQRELTDWDRTIDRKWEKLGAGREKYRTSKTEM